MFTSEIGNKYECTERSNFFHQKRVSFKSDFRYDNSTTYPSWPLFVQNVVFNSQSVLYKDLGRTIDVYFKLACNFT